MKHKENYICVILILWYQLANMNIQILIIIIFTIPKVVDINISYYEHEFNLYTSLYESEVQMNQWILQKFNIEC
jgi:hypothetical protein